MDCPACSSKSSREVPGFITVYECSRCGAIHGHCYLGESYRLVLPQWHTGPEDREQIRYFDLTTVGSAGVERRHGWFHKGTRRIVQVG